VNLYKNRFLITFYVHDKNFCFVSLYGKIVCKSKKSQIFAFWVKNSNFRPILAKKSQKSPDFCGFERVFCLFLPYFLLFLFFYGRFVVH